jgi:hypothetical protein
MARKTFTSRNRAFAALVRGRDNIIVTNTVDSAGAVENIVDSAYIAARSVAGTDSASVISLITNNSTTVTSVDSFGALALIDSVAEADFAYNNITHDVYFATSLNPIFTVSHSLTLNAGAGPNFDQRIVSGSGGGGRVSPFQTITIAKTSRTGNLRIYGAIHSVASLNATFPNSTAGWFCAYQNNVSILIPGETNRRTVNALIIAQTTGTFVDNGDTTKTAPFEIKGIMPITGPGSVTDPDDGTTVSVQNNFYAWDSTLSDTNYVFNHSGASWGLFPISASAVNYPIWTRVDQDSGFVTSIIDSAYVSARAGGGGGGVDSAGITALIDSAYINARASAGTDSATVTTLIEAANDSDRNAGTSIRVFRMSAASELNTLSQHNGLGTEIGTVRVGDIAYIAGGSGRGDAWVLTNISGPQSGYTSTGFRVQTNNGTITRAFFDIVPSGQLPSQNFAVGMSVARGTGGQDARTITAVSDTGAMYNGAPNLGYIDFTPSMSGYAPPFDNKYMHTDPVPLTTWHKLSFDSAEVAAIAASSGGGIDSAAVISIIDSAYINARVDPFDSSHVINLVDSAYIALRDRFQDSSGIIAIVDSNYVQARQSAGGGGGVDSAATITLINSVIDSVGPSRAFTYTYTATANQTTFTGADNNSNTLAYSTGNIITFLNGILLIDSDDYVATTGSSIVLNSPASLNDILNVVKFRASGSGGNLSHEQYKYTVSSPTTTFSGNDDKGNSLSYETGELQVYLNGILLIDSQDYTASNGTSIVLTAATDSNDVLAISRYLGGNSTVNQVNNVFRSTHFVYTTASPTTTITGSDDNSATLSYIENQVQVFQNGILLIDSADYTATNGTSIILGTATDSDDTVVITAFRGAISGGLDSAAVLAISGGGGGGGTDSATVIALSGELKGGMFRINPQTLSINTTIDSAENAHVAGPISFDSGVVLTINGNLVIS